MKKESISFEEMTKPLSVKQYIALTISAPLFFMAITWPSSFFAWSSFFKAFSWYSIVGITQSLGHSYIGYQLNKWVSWKEQPTLRVIITVVTIVAYSVVAYVVVATLLALFWYDISFSKALDIGFDGIWIAVKVSGGFSIFFAMMSFFLNWRRSEVGAERLEKELANYRYNILKNQVNPHFLFNSLNVLTDLVHEDADLSEKYIQQLSKIYRYILKSANHQIVSLAKEVAFIESYIFLLKIRFGEKLKIEMDIHATHQEAMVPVAIQMLIENAVKHNQITKENPLTIRIFKKNHRIFVQNSYQPKVLVKDSEGIGLVNLEQQFSVLSDESIEISQKNNLFTVSLPLLEIKNEKS